MTENKASSPGDRETGGEAETDAADTALITTEPSTAEYEAAARSSRAKSESGTGDRSARESVREFIRLSRSTAIMLVVFLVLLFLYFWVRDEPIVYFDRPDDPEGTTVEESPAEEEPEMTTGVTTPGVTPTETTAPGQGEFQQEVPPPGADTTAPGGQPDVGTGQQGDAPQSPGNDAPATPGGPEAQGPTGGNTDPSPPNVGVPST